MLEGGVDQPCAEHDSIFRAACAAEDAPMAYARISQRAETGDKLLLDSCSCSRRRDSSDSNGISIVLMSPFIAFMATLQTRNACIGLAAPVALAPANFVLTAQYIFGVLHHSLPLAELHSALVVSIPRRGCRISSPFLFVFRGSHGVALTGRSLDRASSVSILALARRCSLRRYNSLRRFSCRRVGLALA